MYEKELEVLETPLIQNEPSTEPLKPLVKYRFDPPEQQQQLRLRIPEGQREEDLPYLIRLKYPCR
jgi:hypothetical protein